MLLSTRNEKMAGHFLDYKTCKARYNAGLWPLPRACFNRLLFYIRSRYNTDIDNGAVIKSKSALLSMPKGGEDFALISYILLLAVVSGVC